MASPAVVALCLLASAVYLGGAQEKKDTVNMPKPDIRLPPPKAEPKTRVNIEGGGSPNNYRVNGRIEHDIFRRPGATITGWGEGSHSHGSCHGSSSHGQVGVGIRVPFGGRRHKNHTQ
uniref:Putative 12 kDa protein n=1 Tax=Ixodes ricinus TaxID=34613 RepID=A0A0K8RJ95_IXORI